MVVSKEYNVYAVTNKDRKVLVATYKTKRAALNRSANVPLWNVNIKYAFVEEITLFDSLRTSSRIVK